MDASHIQKKTTVVSILIMCFLTFNIANAQIHRNGLFKNYSSEENNHSDVLHAITLHVAFDFKSMSFLGLGHSCLQLSTKKNRFPQESIPYHIGLKLGDNTISQNIIASIHANYIRELDINPFIYGLALHFKKHKDL